MDIEFLNQAIKRYFIVILFVIAIAVGGAFAINTFVKPTYQATASIVASIASSGDAGIYNEFLASQLLTGTYKDALKSYHLANKVKEKLGTKLTATELLDKLEVETNVDTLVIRINVKDDHAKDAVAIANAFGETFVEESKTVIQYAHVTILDLASIEQSSEPVSPKKAFNLAVSVFIGIFAGLSFALILEGRRLRRKKLRIENSVS